MSTAASFASTKSSGCGSRLRVMPSRSKIGTSSSMERQKAASLASVCVRAWHAQAAEGEGPRVSSEFIESHPSSTAISIAFCQYRMAARRSSSFGLAQRYIGRSEASRTPCSSRSRLSAVTRSGCARGCTHHSKKSERGESSR
ncbi:MAG: hypothetical protein M5U28_09745 [Sandaracinaceae bacterium]|nr:hypothetical protein [Sandaracinaceae bacterium]